MSHKRHMSAGLPPIADIARRGWHGRKVPKAAVSNPRGARQCGLLPFSRASSGSWENLWGGIRSSGPVAELVGIEGGVVSGVFNLESSGVEAPDRRPRHEEHYHEA